MRVLAALALLVAPLGALAQSGTLRLTASPPLSVADGRSTVTITAEVRDSSGGFVRDGVPVAFSTSLGSFREDTVPVYGGKARAVLVASTVPGVAKITASAVTVGAVNTLEFEFVSDRSQLVAASEYAEMTSPGGVLYNVDLRTLAAAAPNRGASFRYRDIRIEADDIQYDVGEWTVRARKARVSIGRASVDADEAVVRLLARKAFVTAEYPVQERVAVPRGLSFAFETQTRKRYGIAELRSGGLQEPSERISPEAFAFEDLSVATSAVRAESVVVFPRKELQFQRAEVLVADTRVMKLPLYQLSVYSPVLVTEDFFSIQNNQVAINYPYFLSLRPGFSSALRFRTGESYGRGLHASSGAFLDYEVNWSSGDRMEGGFTFAGIGRDDYSLQLRQNYRPDDLTQLFLNADFTEGRSLFGSLSLSRQFRGFQAGLSANATTAVRGTSYANRFVSFTAERDPIALKSLPAKLFLGVTATESEALTPAGGYSQSTAGLRARLQAAPQRLDSQTTVAMGLALSAVSGRRGGDPIGLEATAALTRQLGTGASLLVTYNFNDDPFSGRVLGKHRLAAQGSYLSGRMRLSGYLARSLDIERTSYLVDASFRFSPLWRLSTSYTQDSFLGASYSDFNLVLSYRLGLRDFGLVYSGTTKRFGIQVLGAAFD
ncbi:MAG: Ig-like domain-containing protein [Fimbriimonadales bacterium]|nr:Ig-like domain-containing protein [Fimbriimonadales bacterium]